MKKTFSLMLVLVVALTLVLSACGAKKNNEGGSTGNEPNKVVSDNTGKDFKIGMVTDVGGVHDKSFNQSAWEALQTVTAETSAQTKFLESKGEADMEPNLNSFVKEGYDLTWGIGFLFFDAMTKVAAENPNAKLAVIDSEIEAPNIASVTFAENEGSYLVGVVAGLMTKTNKIGFVGGMKIPVITRFEAGFKAGVAAVNPDAKITIEYAGDFGKPDLGKLAASTMYDAGVDIIFHAAGGTGNGVFNEAKTRKDSGENVWVIGVDKDQSLEYGDEITLTSMVKGVDAAVQKVSKDLIAGNWAGGTTQVLGLKDNAVGLPETSSKNVPADVLKKVEEYKEKIISGEIKVPTE
ncbi:basic membrane protein A [Paenibacillus castaneae]|uniref:BMP family lipoprotein n=1 Tax=Paenibacillus castaneae TaxID=474957 RepID=UPI000C9A2894|nr:BMP family protein [Paenibacillus castaneae]NIK80102.1 basic membrane protein A [Paenibacillus castaneae]